MTIFEQFINILKLLKLRPASGYGVTEIKWYAGEVIEIRKTDVIKPEELIN